MGRALIKRDERNLDHKTLEEMRLLAVRRRMADEESAPPPSSVCIGPGPSSVVRRGGAMVRECCARAPAAGDLPGHRPPSQAEEGGHLFLGQSEFRADQVQGKTCSAWLRPGTQPRRIGLKSRQAQRLAERVHAQLADIGRRPALVRAFFKHPSVAYITDY